MTDALVAKKQQNPGIIIQLITDPINELYGGLRSPQFALLEDSGVGVITTDLKPLRDSNPLYSGFWRTFLKWFGNSYREGVLPNILQSNTQKISFRSYLSALNFKANHRKIVMTDYTKDDETGFSVLVTSANPHDGSSTHSNSAIRIDSDVWRDVLATERAVAIFSGVDFLEPRQETIRAIEKSEASTGNTRVQLLTEATIRNKIVSSINNLEAGDTLDMAMFYIADRKVIKAIKDADTRSVKIRLLLDPNKDAFGREKKGLPNRQVASELNSHTNGNTIIRWCDTHGEQCHSKLLLMKSSDGYEMILGSANLTRRNIGNFNLETNVYIESDEQIDAIDDAYNFFNMTWSNEGGRLYSTNYDTYNDEGFFKKIRYRTSEALGTNRW